MLSNKSKIVFLAVVVILPFIIYSVIYYKQMLYHSKFKEKNLEYFTYEMVNKNTKVRFNSQTDSLFLTHEGVRDTIICSNVSKKELATMFKKASIMGFWDLPPKLLDKQNPDPNNSKFKKITIHFTNFQLEVCGYGNYDKNLKMREGFDAVSSYIEKLIERCYQ